jgi:diadenosine tetraphosphate (Ap4A) HIT family hydrolase
MKECIFCHHISDSAVLYRTQHFKLVFDIEPIQTGHLPLISENHYESLTQLPLPVLHELIETEAYLVELMDEGTHFHVHLIPRTKNDGFWNMVDIEQIQLPIQSLLEKLKG